MHRRELQSSALDGRPGYAEQFTQVLDSFGHELSAGDCVVLGDLNASLQGPSRDAHAVNLDRASALGLVSAYHAANDVAHGNEPDMTLKWIGPGRVEYRYHCDFVFVPEAIANRISCYVVPTFSWERSVSDHQPVLVELPTGALRAGRSS